MKIGSTRPGGSTRGLLYRELRVRSGGAAVCKGALLIAISLAACVAGPAQTQEPDTAARFESAPLAPDHWATRAAERAAALGLAPEFLHVQRAVPMRTVGLALRRAAARADTGHPRLVELTRGWYERFTGEFPSFEGQLEGTAPALSVTRREARAGVEGNAGRVAPGRGQYQFQTGAKERAAPTGGWTSLRLAIQAGGRLAVAGEPVLRAGSEGVEGGDAAVTLSPGDWSASVGAGPVTLRVGHGSLWYGFGEGAVVFGGNEAIDKLEVESRAPFRLPGLGFLGPFAFHTALSRLDEGRHTARPWLLATSAIVRPHPRADLELNRGFIFGGDNVPLTVTRLTNMLVGQQGGSGANVTFANQIASLAARWRVPSEALLPATAYMEWGMDDGSGAWAQVPGVVLGMYVPALPGVPEVSAGFEHSLFTQPCCGHPIWYRHAAFPGGWALSERPAGHALGGDGSEATVYTRAHALRSRLFVDARLFLRSRGPENLFSPEREGDSQGYHLRASYLTTRHLEFGLDAFQDSGGDWTERAVVARVSSYF